LQLIVLIVLVVVVGGTHIQGLREELEAASAVVAKLHARIARVTSFVRFMVRTIPPHDHSSPVCTAHTAVVAVHGGRWW
jgi:hypothetical protein